MVNYGMIKSESEANLIKYSESEINEFLAIAKDRFDAGHTIAYIPLWGDPDRTRNFAGIWIAENRAYYGVKLVGRLLGQNVETNVYSTDSLRDAVIHSLIIWESYKSDSF